MVETSVKPQRKHARRWRTVLLALLAVGFLLAMILTGQLPETRQLVKFEARGVLAMPPEQVRRVDLYFGEHTITFVRLSDHVWVAGKGQEPISGELQEHLEQAIAFMHTSRPVRVMQRAEYHRTPLHEFGLEQPRCAVVLSDARRVLLAASFGAYNPQDLLQYMQLRGDSNLYLMSRFVGQAWEHLGHTWGSGPSHHDEYVVLIFG
jgi:hypothetical protein